MSVVAPTGAGRLARALGPSRKGEGPALCAFLTAGFPSREAFLSLLPRIAAVADAVEIGIPFSDPMADGVTIQRASRAALAGGVTPGWVLEVLGDRPGPGDPPLVLMSYVNPLLAFGLEDLARRAAASRISGFVVPDLPFEECGPFRGALERQGLALVQMVTPATPPGRMGRQCRESGGFVYAVTLTGTTGAAAIPAGTSRYLRQVRQRSTVPVLAGFGIRRASQVRSIGRVADGVIVGSALLEEIEQGRDPVAFLRALRGIPSPKEIS